MPSRPSSIFRSRRSSIADDEPTTAADVAVPIEINILVVAALLAAPTTAKLTSQATTSTYLKAMPVALPRKAACSN